MTEGNGLPFDVQEINTLLENIDTYSERDLIELYAHVEELEKRQYKEDCRNDLIAFCKHMMSDYMVGAHHRHLSNLLIEVESGEKDRLIVNIAPRHGKSMLLSEFFMAWYLGKNPKDQVILVSHTSDLAVDFGRKVRNMVATDKYKEIFPDVSISTDSKSAGRWNTNHGGIFYATGVGSALAGRGAHLLVIDDPFSEQDVLNGNFEVFEKAYQWFTYGARTRLMKGGRIAIVQCMTGDTPVLMGDGREKPLRDVRPGDWVATYDDGGMTTEKVLNHRSNGPDQVFVIKMASEVSVRANERHPFLVRRGKEEAWVRVKDLRTGDSVVSRSLSLSSASEFATDTIVHIAPAGVEEVFDIQVERTENFIANGLVSHNTRWHMDDLTGRLIRDMAKNKDTDQYKVVEFPAVMETENAKTGEIKEKALWPEMFDLAALKRIKAGMPTFQWNAQFQQNPTAEEAALIKREWWRIWKPDDPPSCEYIIMSLDAAAETHNRADFTSLTTWGVFLNEDTDNYNIILLNSICERFEFPELKVMCLQEYREWDPDSFIVEKKSAGVAIYQEMRRMGLPVQEFTPHRGTGDKMARLNSVSDIVASGMVWVPETRWADELVEEIAAFPFASHDDRVDSSVQALVRFRQGGFLRLPTDEPDEIQYFKRKKSGYY